MNWLDKIAWDAASIGAALGRRFAQPAAQPQPKPPLTTSPEALSAMIGSRVGLGASDPLAGLQRSTPEAVHQNIQPITNKLTFPRSINLTR